MFVARVSLLATTEGLTTLIDNLGAEMVETPRRFEGCERFEVAVSVRDPLRINLIEEWTTRQNFDAYQESEFFADTMTTLGPCLAEGPDSAYYDAERVGP